MLPLTRMIESVEKKTEICDRFTRLFDRCSAIDKLELHIGFSTSLCSTISNSLKDIKINELSVNRIRDFEIAT